jgi:hypothetical protein
VWPCSFCDTSGSGMIHQYPSHDVGGDSDEMSATRPCLTPGPQTQICFMQYRGGYGYINYWPV